MITDNVMILHQKVYNFIGYTYGLLKKFPNNERFCLEQHIRNTLYDTLEEIIRYENSGGGMSHMYTVDANIAILKEYFKLSKDTGIKCINNQKIIVITRYLDEIGRLIGGIIYSKNKKKAVETAKKYRNERDRIIINIRSENLDVTPIEPISFYDPKVVTSPVIFDKMESPFKFSIANSG